MKNYQLHFDYIFLSELLKTATRLFTSQRFHSHLTDLICKMKITEIEIELY